MLMLDRYLVAGGRALDLATGAAIRWHLRSGRASPPPLFTVKGRSWLIDFDRRGASRIEIWERLAGATKLVAALALPEALGHVFFANL